MTKIFVIFTNFFWPHRLAFFYKNYFVDDFEQFSNKLAPKNFEKSKFSKIFKNFQNFGEKSKKKKNFLQKYSYFFVIFVSFMFFR